MSDGLAQFASQQDLEKIYQATIQLVAAHVAALGDKAPLPGSEAEIGLIGGCTATAVMAYRHVTGRKIDVAGKGGAPAPSSGGSTPSPSRASFVPRR